MADTKISALTAATTPLAGTEVLPIVQSGVTKQVSVANLTAGRAVSADSLTLTGSPLPATSGGTGQSSYAVGDLLYASTTTALSKLADVATGNALISGGVGVAPSWGKIGLTTHVSGTLAVGNGGTGNTTGAATAVTSNATTGVMQIVGPAASSTRVMTIPDANFTAARTDAAQTFTGIQSFAGSTQNVRVYGGSATHQWDIYGNGNNLRFSDNTGSGLVQFDTDINMNGGNIIQGTAGKGINFTANSAAAGMTSQLLNWYEEGTWTPAMVANTSGSITLTTAVGKYTRIGRQVTVTAYCDVASVSSPTGALTISGLPFTNGSAASNRTAGSVWTTGLSATAITSIVARMLPSESFIRVDKYSAGQVTDLASNIVASVIMQVSITYFV